MTSLHLASQLGQTDILYHLLARGGDVELRDVNRLTALDLTSSYEVRLIYMYTYCLSTIPPSANVDRSVCSICGL